jgi:predicted regulator of amino acid metabolism with ACT domain
MTAEQWLSLLTVLVTGIGSVLIPLSFRTMTVLSRIKETLAEQKVQISQIIEENSECHGDRAKLHDDVTAIRVSIAGLAKRGS